LDCPQATEMLHRLFEQTGMKFGLVSFVLHQDEPYVYDIDPDPLFNWLPEDMKQILVQGLAAGISGRKITTKDATPIGPLQRPAMFLRRMLQPLFTFEHNKKS
ncbi:MAG: hypothetical protein GY862_21015, partial [Gammaproteobacteria bacterium]|nr:hypothetical protein [Gammaproteobacteria bacterium]